MACDNTLFPGCVLLPSRFTSQAQTSLLEKFMLAVPGQAAIRYDEARPAPPFSEKAIFTMFVGVLPTLLLFRHFFILCRLKSPSEVGGRAFELWGQQEDDFIPLSLRKKWDDWETDWFYTRLPDHPRLQLPTGPPAQIRNWLVAPDLSPEYDAALTRITGLRRLGLTSHIVFGDFPHRRIAVL
uniref:Uncharacterized protein n=1 Tax=Oryza brachyantha TaxID=4533 RepID=J3N230_ORYBR